MVGGGGFGAAVVVEVAMEVEGIPAAGAAAGAADGAAGMSALGATVPNDLATPPTNLRTSATPSELEEALELLEMSEVGAPQVSAPSQASADPLPGDRPPQSLHQFIWPSTLPPRER